MTSVLPGRLPARLDRIVNAALIATLAWLLAGVVWSVVVPGQTHVPDLADAPVPASDGTRGAGGNEATSRRSGFLRSAQYEPFGTLQESAAAAVEEAPDTRLRLELVGVLATGQGAGSAIIVAGGGPAELYHVGATIGDNLATLHQVHKDRVILRREGRYETLRLPRAEDPRVRATATESRATATPDAATETAPPAPVTARLSRSRWLENPERVMDALRAQPVVRNGNLFGIRVSPTRNQREFQRAGLRDGDIITSVEGQSIRTIDNPQQLLSRIGDAEQVNIVIERGGQTLPLTVELTE